MGSPLNILQVFVEYPGDLLFFLLVIVISQASLFFALGQRRRFPLAQATQRYAVASSTLLGLWLLMLGAALAAISTTLEPGSLLPPLERLAQTLSVTVLAWALLTADAEAWNKAGNLSIRGMVIIILLFYAYTAFAWYGEFDAGVEFNGSNLAPVWSALPAIVAFAGLSFCLFRSGEIVDAPLKGVFFLLLLLGNGWDLVRFSEEVVAGNYLGSARLAYMGGLALLPLLLYRQAISMMETALAAAERSSEQPRSTATPSDIADPVAPPDAVTAVADAEDEGEAESLDVTSPELDGAGSVISREERLAERRDLARGFEQDVENLAKARLARTETRSRLRDAQKRLLSQLGQGPGDPEISQELALLFAEFDRLCDACDQCAVALVDAKTVKALLDAEDSDVAPVLGAYLNMIRKQLDESHKRLQGQLDALGTDHPGDAGFAATARIDRLREKAGQLESELDSLTGDLSATTAELDALGIDPDLGGLAQALIQVFVERRTYERKLASAREEQDHLADALSRSQMDVEVLESTRQELKRLRQEHEGLLNSRENIRRAYDDLQVGLEAKVGEALELEEEIGSLRDQLVASASRQENMRRNIVVITEERDNLLKIRDQLTKRIADALADSESTNAEALSRQIDQLRATVADLTVHRQLLEDQLQDLSAQLELSSESSVEGSAPLVEEIKRLSRDLQTPMTAISQATEILLAERVGILGEAQLRLLQQVSGNILMLSQILRELNLVAMLPDDDFALEYRPSDFVALLDDALSRQAPELRKKGLTIDLSLSDSLPDIPMDADCVKEIVNQLLGNAIQVSSESAQITLVVELDRMLAHEDAAPVDVLRLSVQDSGEGIPPKEFDRVFARTYRAENPRIVGLGDTGVGLAVSRAIARAHGGDLWITSEPGAGSIFHLALPVSPAQTIED